MKTRKINCSGFAHYILPMALFVVAVVIGTGYFVASHADTPTPTSSQTVLGWRSGSKSPSAVSGIPGTVVQVSTSNAGGYALTSTGQVWAWGANESGERGSGTTAPPTQAMTATQVIFPSGVTIASLPPVMPYDTGMAIDSNGDVWGWGHNAGSFTNKSFTPLCVPGTNITKPVQLPFTNVTLAAGAGDHAIYDTNGVIQACGDNNNGDLGNGSITGSNTPVTIVGLPNEPISYLTASWGDSGAVMADGSYYNWGYNKQGQLGDGTTKMGDVPVLVSLPASVKQVAEGGSAGGNGQTIVLLSNGSVWTWGANGSGQLGNGTLKQSQVPIVVTPPNGVTWKTVASGGESSYAIDTTGNLWGWGNSGDNTVVKNSETPIRIAGATNLSQVSSTANVGETLGN